MHLICYEGGRKKAKYSEESNWLYHNKNWAKRFLTNTKSYGGISIETEHEFFKDEYKFRYEMRLDEIKKKVSIAGLHDQLKLMEYKTETNQHIKQKNNNKKNIKKIK